MEICTSLPPKYRSCSTMDHSCSLNSIQIIFSVRITIYSCTLNSMQINFSIRIPMYINRYHNIFIHLFSMSPYNTIFSTSNSDLGLKKIKWDQRFLPGVGPHPECSTSYPSHHLVQQDLLAHAASPWIWWLQSGHHSLLLLVVAASRRVGTGHEHSGSPHWVEKNLLGLLLHRKDGPDLDPSRNHSTHLSASDPWSYKTKKSKPINTTTKNMRSINKSPRKDGRKKMSWWAS